jgi:GNAT superfamily N-acetyltransferase
MDKQQIAIEPIANADLAAAGELVEAMWRLHGEKTRLIDEENVIHVRAANDMLGKENASVFVARVNGEVVGAISCLVQSLPRYYSEKTEAYIDDLSVSPKYQRQGIASRLVRACEDFAKSKGVKVLSTKVWSFNHKSAALMERNHFTNDFSFYHKFIN